MTRFLGVLQTGFAIFLYLLSAITFIDYMYSLTIRDTVTAVENAFGTLVILIFMLILAKFTLAAGKRKLRESQGNEPGASSPNPASADRLDTGQTDAKEEAEK